MSILSSITTQAIVSRMHNHYGSSESLAYHMVADFAEHLEANEDDHDRPINDIVDDLAKDWGMIPMDAPKDTGTDPVDRLAATLTPTVHLNGDSKKTLLQNWASFRAQLADLPVPEVHARNYYVQGDDAPMDALKASRELQEMLATVHKVADAVCNKLSQY